MSTTKRPYRFRLPRHWRSNPVVRSITYAASVAEAVLIRSEPPAPDPTVDTLETIDEARPARRPGTYRAWADLLKRTSISTFFNAPSAMAA
jgi:hypothetical protein